MSTEELQEAVAVFAGASSTPEERIAARVVLMQAITEIVNAKRRPVDAPTIRKALLKRGVRVPTPLVRTTASMAARKGMIESKRPVGISYMEAYYGPSR